MTRSNVLIANQLVTGSGADASSRPSAAFGDADTGFYETTDDKLSVTLGGTERFHFSGSEFVKADGTAYITSSSLTDDSVLNRHVSAQAGISLSKLMSGTQGEVLFYNSASQVSGLAVGTSGQYLMTQGAGQNPVYTSVPAGNLSRKYSVSWTVRDSSATEFFEVANHAIAAGAVDRNGMILVRGSYKNTGVGSASPLIRLRYNSQSVNNQFTAQNADASGTTETKYEILYSRANNSNNSTSAYGYSKVGTNALIETGITTAVHNGAGDVLAEAANIILYATGHGQPAISGAIEILY